MSEPHPIVDPNSSSSTTRVRLTSRSRKHCLATRLVPTEPSLYAKVVPLLPNLDVILKAKAVELLAIRIPLLVNTTLGHPSSSLLHGDVGNLVVVAGQRGVVVTDKPSFCPAFKR